MDGTSAASINLHACKTLASYRAMQGRFNPGARGLTSSKGPTPATSPPHWSFTTHQPHFPLAAGCFCSLAPSWIDRNHGNQCKCVQCLFICVCMWVYMHVGVNMLCLRRHIPVLSMVDRWRCLEGILISTKCFPRSGYPFSFRSVYERNVTLGSTVGVSSFAKGRRKG